MTRRLVGASGWSLAALGLGALSPVFALPSIAIAPELTEVASSTSTFDLHTIAPLLKAMSPVMAPLAVVACLTGAAVAVAALPHPGLLYTLVGFALSAASFGTLLVALTTCGCWN